MEKQTNANGDNTQEHMTKNDTPLKSKRSRPSLGGTSGYLGVELADADESQGNTAAHCVCCGVSLDDENTAISPEKFNARSSKVAGCYIGDVDEVDAAKLYDNAAYHLWKQFGILLDGGRPDLLFPGICLNSPENWSPGGDSTEGSCIPEEYLNFPENYLPGGDCPRPFSSTIAIIERVREVGRELLNEFDDELKREVIINRG